MMESVLIKLFAMALCSGIVGSIIGGMVGYFSGDPRLRLGNSTGIGFLIGAAIGATVAVFANLGGRL